MNRFYYESQHGNYKETNQAGVLRCSGSLGMSTIVMTRGEQMSYVVRRLTPDECEMLQGFPVGHTDIKKRIRKNKDGSYTASPCEQTADGARYKALGNSMAVPVMKWIGQRIEMVERGLL